MSASKSGPNNPNYQENSYGRYYFDMSRAEPFQAGSLNPQWKGTYVLDVNQNVQYGPFSKGDALSTFHISPRKYYQVLNTDTAYKGYKYQNIDPFDIEKYGKPTLNVS